MAVAGARARVARGSRIWVEGRHDAELVEKVWGDDLRIEGVVVEPLHGSTTCPTASRELRARTPAAAPRRARRPLVPGSKETRIAEQVGTRYAGLVMVVGHPYVDVWQAIRPPRSASQPWPVIARGTPWKHGVLRALGRPAVTDADVARGWQWLLGHVGHVRRPGAELFGRVEQLIDFVTA